MANRLARSFRKRSTNGEDALWNELRELRRQGFHFRRQVQIDDFIVDFACFSQRLVVEVDGAQHERPAHKLRDSNRDAHLRSIGFNVVRVSNADVSENMDGVMLEILAALGAAVRYE